MSDDQIAMALELHHGLGMTWKVVAFMMGMSVTSLREQVNTANHRGMR